MGDTDDEAQSADPTAASSADPDPVKAAGADAWLAQFRADNAAAVMQHNFAASKEESAAAKAAESARDFDLKQAAAADGSAAEWRTAAADFEQKAQQDRARHDEYELQAQLNVHSADEATSLATTFRADAQRESDVALAAHQEASELYGLYGKSGTEYEIMQEQAVAAKRIATDEAKLSHPGDAAPDEPHQP